MGNSAIIGAANELFAVGHYPSVAAVCGDALVDDPQDLELRLLMCRALVALRREREARKHLDICLQHDSSCALAYQLLGELSMQRGEPRSAEIFFREALRLEPHNRDAKLWLDVALGSNQPAAAVDKLPATTAAAGCDVGARKTGNRPGKRAGSGRGIGTRVIRSKRRFAVGTEPLAPVVDAAAPASGRSPTAQAATRLTRRPAAASVPSPMPSIEMAPRLPTRRAKATPPPRRRRSETMPPPIPAASRRRRSTPPPIPAAARTGGSHLFGAYLVANGVLTEQQLQQSLGHQHSRGGRIGEAAVALGYVSIQKIEWAALAYHAQGRASA